MNTEYITDIVVLSEKKSSVSVPNGYTKLSQDLNQGAGGNYIYICFKKEPYRKDLLVITDIKASTSKSIEGYSVIDKDLNKGAGGKYIYLHIKKEKFTEENKETLSAVTDITTVVGKNADAPSGFVKLYQDLNEGAGGKYIYLCLKRNRPVNSSDGGNTKVKYQISFYTADEFKAGTDANIFIKMRGELGQSDEYRVNKYLSGNAFERNDVDTLVLELDQNLGRIYELVLRSDMMYAGAGWRLNKVLITREGDQNRSLFDIHDWISDKDSHTYYDPSALGSFNTSFEDRVVQNKIIHTIPANVTMTIEDSYEMMVGYLLSETKVQEISTSTKVGASFSQKGSNILGKSTLGANIEFALNTRNSTEKTAQINTQKKQTLKQTACFEKCDHERRFKAEYVQRIEHNVIQLGSLQMSVPNVLDVRTVGFKEVFD